LPGDQVVCLGHDQAAWSGPAINQLGVVNPWQPPLQKPHPPIWAAGISSPETIRWAARQRISYLVLGSGPAGR
jgi:alkanesulfonate monooxygenase SsuD/methylene tetrahydromethanopterin reductase-like flavin-dependent oxidoreductase (luciferase family)